MAFCENQFQNQGHRLVASVLGLEFTSGRRTAGTECVWMDGGFWRKRVDGDISAYAEEGKPASVSHPSWEAA